MMTYGWAILIIVIVAAILWSFGVFNPSSSRSQAVTGFAGLGSVQAACYNNGTLLISIGDSTGLAINVTAINATSPLFSGQKVIRPNKTVTPTGSSLFGINNACPATAGSSFSLNLVVTYKQIGAILSGLQFSSGTLSGTIAAPPPLITTFSETGLPTGTNWSVTYNSVKKYSTSGQITFSGGSGTLSFSIASQSANLGIFLIGYNPANASGNLLAGTTKNVLFSNQTKSSKYVFAANNSAQGGVFQINSSSNAIVKSRKISCAPRGIAISPNGQEVWVACYAVGTIFRLNASTFNFLSSNITTGLAGGWGLAFTPNRKLLYGGNYNVNSIPVINVTSDAVLTTISIGTTSQGVGVAPDGKKAYVAEWGLNKLAVINTSSNSVITNITVGSNPHGIAVSPDGKLVYVSNYNSGTVSKINTTSNTAIATITVGPTPQGLAFTPNGRLLYVDVANTAGRLLAINTTSNAIAANISTGVNLQDSDLTMNGNIVYITFYYANEIYVLNSTTNSVITTVPLTQPIGISALTWGDGGV